MLKFLRNLDFLLLGSTFFLILIGLATTFFLSRDNPLIRLQITKQIIFALTGLTLFIVLAYFDLRFLRTRSLWVLLVYGAAVLSLVLVLIFGVRVHGATSWFRIGLFTLQPIEFVNIAIILLLSKYFSVRHAEIARFRHIAISGLYVVIPIGIAVFQPDLGAAIVLGAIWLGTLLLLELPLRHIVILGLGGLAIFIFAWVSVLAPYQKGRLISFALTSDPQGAGYHARQAIVSVGSGGLTGRQAGEPTQASQDFLPESTTDFIFAASVERFGLVGATAIILGFLVLLWRIIRIASLATNNFIRSFAAGSALLFFTHGLIHVGMNLGLMPVTGLPMPFFSYGGSHLISGFIILGILESLRIHQAQMQLDTNYLES